MGRKFIIIAALAVLAVNSSAWPGESKDEGPHHQKLNRTAIALKKLGVQEEKSVSAVVSGTRALFEILRKQIAACADGTLDRDYMTQDVQTKILNRRYMEEFNGYADGLLVFQSGSSKIIEDGRSLSFVQLLLTVVNVTSGINLMTNKDPSCIRDEADKFEAQSISIALQLMDDVYRPILGCQKWPRSVVDQVTEFRKQTGVFAKQVIVDMWRAVRIALAHVFPDLHLRRKGDYSTLESLEKKIIKEIQEMVNSVWKSIYIIFKATTETKPYHSDDRY